MVVDAINVYYATVLESEVHPPIPRHDNSIVALQVTSQWVKLKSRKVKVLGALTPIENAQDIP